MSLSWNSTGKIGRIGRHLAETHRHYRQNAYGQMPPDASDFPGGILALDLGLGLYPFAFAANIVLKHHVVI